MSERVIDEQGRPEPPLTAGEVGTLVGFLDYQRATLAWKARGLDAQQLGTPLPAHPSGMTLAGLIKHLAWVEDYWFTEVLGRTSMPAPWADVDWKADGDWEWNSAREDSAEELQTQWESSVGRSRAALERALATDEVDPLAATHPAWGGQGQVSVRWILTHMIEEYARHNGHADLLREPLDGQTGE